MFLTCSIKLHKGLVNAVFNICVHVTASVSDSALNFPAASNDFYHTGQFEQPLHVPAQETHDPKESIVPIAAVSSQNLGGESWDQSALFNLITNFSSLAHQFKLVSTAALTAVNVSHGWFGPPTPPSSSSVPTTCSD